jgi:hypothetical protein
MVTCLPARYRSSTNQSTFSYSCTSLPFFGIPASLRSKSYLKIKIIKLFSRTNMFIFSLLSAALAVNYVANCAVPPQYHDIRDIQSLSTCKKALPKGQTVGGTYNITIKSSGAPRWYLITIPARYRSQIATPVILSSHGGSRDAQRQLDLSQLSNPIFNDFAIAVYPNGINVGQIYI